MYGVRLNTFLASLSARCALTVAGFCAKLKQCHWHFTQMYFPFPIHVNRTSLLFVLKIMRSLNRQQHQVKAFSADFCGFVQKVSLYEASCMLSHPRRWWCWWHFIWGCVVHEVFLWCSMWLSCKFGTIQFHVYGMVALAKKCGTCWSHVLCRQQRGNPGVCQWATLAFV